MPAGAHLGLAHAHPHPLGREALERASSAIAEASASSSRNWPPATSRTAGGDLAVVDRVLDPVVGAALADLELDVVEEPLAALALVLVDAVVAEELEPAQLDLHRAYTACAAAQRLDVLADVVGADQRRAALVGGDRDADRGGGRPDRRRAGRRGSARASSCARSRSATGRPIATSSGSRRTSSKLCATVLPKPMPGSRQTSSSRIPCRDREREPLLEERLHLARRRRRSAGRPASSRGVAAHVHQAEVGSRRRRRRRRARGRREARSRR